MLRVITDFDGPIMDISDRYYQVYRQCVAETKEPKQKVRILSKTEFWQLKRCRTPEVKIAQLSGLNGDQASAFAQRRQEIAHQLERLKSDQVIPGAIASLQPLHQSPQVDLVVMTMRKKAELDVALHQHQLAFLFPENRRYFLPNDYQKTSDLEDKPKLMARAVAELPPVSQTWMIGDKEADIVAAQRQNIPVIAVLSGIRDRQTLAKYHPDLIVNTLVEAIEIMQTQVPELFNVNR